MVLEGGGKAGWKAGGDAAGPVACQARTVNA
jgi:hypothetical protein